MKKCAKSFLEFLCWFGALQLGFELYVGLKTLGGLLYFGGLGLWCDMLVLETWLVY